MNQKNYYSINKKKVYRVSAIISHCEDKTGLFEWRKKVGAEVAQQITTEAARLGTRIHKALECDQDYAQFTEYLGLFTPEEQKQIKKYLQNYAYFRSVFNNTMTEEKVHYSEFGTNYEYAGTFDALGVLTKELYDRQGKIAIKPHTTLLIDYKNYAKQKNIKFLTKAFLQLGAYYHAVLNNKLADVEGCLLLTCTSRQLNYYYMDAKLSKYYAQHFLICLDYYLKKRKYPWEHLMEELGYADMRVVNSTNIPKRLYPKTEIEKLLEKDRIKHEQAV